MSRVELIKIVSEASPEDRQFLETFLLGLRNPTPQPKEDLPPVDDPLYRLHELAVPGEALTNKQIDAIVYGLD
jgi:hypothetical protein